MKPIIYTLGLLLFSFNAFSQLKWEKSINTSEAHSTSPEQVFVHNGALYVIAQIIHEDNLSNEISFHPSPASNTYKVVEIDDNGDIQSTTDITGSNIVPSGYFPIKGLFYDNDIVYKPLLAPVETNPDANTFTFGRAVAYVKYDVVYNTGNYYIDNTNMVTSFLTHGVNSSGDFYSFAVNKYGEYCVFQTLDNSLTSGTYIKHNKIVLGACYDEHNDIYYVITDESGTQKLNSMNSSGTLTYICSLPSTIDVIEGTEMFFDGTYFYALTYDGSDFEIIKFNSSGTEQANRVITNFSMIKQSPDGDLYLIEHDKTNYPNNYTYYQLDNSLGTAYSYQISTDDVMPIDMQFIGSGGSLEIYVVGYTIDDDAFQSTHITAFDYYTASINSEDKIIIKPNPLKNSVVTIDLGNNVNLLELKDIKIVAIDIKGAVNEVSDFSVLNKEQIKLENLNFSTGSYVINILTNDTLIGSGKVLVE